MSVGSEKIGWAPPGESRIAGALRKKRTVLLGKQQTWFGKESVLVDLLFCTYLGEENLC